MAAMTSTISAPSGGVHDITTGDLAEVERLFCIQLSPLRLFPGATLAIYQHDRLVLDLVGGFAEMHRSLAHRT
jgi:hypothetical protein